MFLNLWMIYFFPLYRSGSANRADTMNSQQQSVKANYRIGLVTSKAPQTKVSKTLFWLHILIHCSTSTSNVTHIRSFLQQECNENVNYIIIAPIIGLHPIKVVEVYLWKGHQNFKYECFNLF